VSTPYITITIKVQIFVHGPPVVLCMMRITFIFHAFGKVQAATADVAVIPRSHGMLTASAVAVALKTALFSYHYYNKIITKRRPVGACATPVRPALIKRPRGKTMRRDNSCLP
jgi:hypothetical protein